MSVWLIFYKTDAAVPACRPLQEGRAVGSGECGRRGCRGRAPTPALTRGGRLPMAPQAGGAAALRAQEEPRAAETEAAQGPIPPTGGLRARLASTRQQENCRLSGPLRNQGPPGSILSAAGPLYLAVLHLALCFLLSPSKGDGPPSSAQNPCYRLNDCAPQHPAKCTY